MLISMFTERIDSTSSLYRELPIVCRLLTRRLQLQDEDVEQITAAAHLMGLDWALKRELGMPLDRHTFESTFFASATPGGLNASLRALGHLLLEENPVHPQILRMLSDFFAFRTQEDGGDLQHVIQRLQSREHSQELIDALIYAVSQLPGLMMTRSHPMA